MQDRPTAIDLRTPVNATLTAFYKRSFAYQTVKVRWPALLQLIKESLSKRKDEMVKAFGDEALEDVKFLISQIAELKSEIENNKPLRKLVGNAPDIALYNKYFNHYCIKVWCPTYYNSIWLYAECYMYRRIQEALEQTKFFNDLDLFKSQKEEAFGKTLQLMVLMGVYLLNVLNCPDDEKQLVFEKLVKLNLWSNKCDLSFSPGHMKSAPEDLTDEENLNKNILRNDLLHIWDALTEMEGSKIVDIVLDNAGYELFSDLCLADFIIKSKYAIQVRFYVKVMPWFISDVTNKDFLWTLQQLKTTKNATLKKLADRWNNYFRVKAWTIEEHNFWTLPNSYNDMASWDLELYTKLSEAKLLIFKGDLNYRKLIGERNWPTTTPFETALQGFNPTKLCALRMVKADLICGLADGVADEIEAKDKDWLINGNYGIIQFCDAIDKE